MLNWELRLSETTANNVGQGNKGRLTCGHLYL